MVLVAAWLSFMPGCQAPPRQFVGVGDVVAVDAASRRVTIRHDAIVGFADAATTAFDAADDMALAADDVGHRVRFVLRERSGRMMLTEVTRLELGNPGVHDHTPHHAGVVGMVGMTHLEARAEPDGRIRVYLTDRWRRPLPLSDTRGTVTLTLPDGKRTYSFVAGADALEASGPALTVREVNAEIQIDYGGQRLDMTFQLPLASSGGGAAGIPTEGCVAPASRAGVGRLPRCTLAFRGPIGVLAATPDGSRLIVAAADIGVSAWRVESKRLLAGFAPAPAVTLTAPEPPHVEVANAVAVRPGGREAVVALESRLILYDIDSGRILHVRSGPGGIVRSVAWSPNGSALLVTIFYDAKAHLLAAEDGRVLQRFAVEREGAGVAFSVDGRIAAVGSQAGPITLFDGASGAVRRVLSGSAAAARALTFVGSRLVAVSDDGALRLWDVDESAAPIEVAVGNALSQLAQEPGGPRIATGGRDGFVRVYDVLRCELVETLAWHTTQITALAWAGATLIAGDGNGNVTFWEMPVSRLPEKPDRNRHASFDEAANERGTFCGGRAKLPLSRDGLRNSARVRGSSGDSPSHWICVHRSDGPALRLIGISG
jgi:Cu/Ag efflux protein CusF